MDYLIKGIVIGLGLNLLLGPIFIIITQTSIEKGAKQGLFVASGIWISDFLFAYVCSYFFNHILPITNSPSFKLYLGIIGGIVLIVIGLNMLNKNRKNNRSEEEIELVKQPGYFNYALQGFLVNTINPFTFFFWAGVFTSVVYGEKTTGFETGMFLSGILGVIIVFDILKVVLAKKITRFFTKERLYHFNKYSGWLFISFGIILMIRSI